MILISKWYTGECEWQGAVAIWMCMELCPNGRGPYYLDLRGPRMLLAAQAAYERKYGSIANLKGQSTQRAKQLLALLKSQGELDYKDKT